MHTIRRVAHLAFLAVVCAGTAAGQAPPPVLLVTHGAPTVAPGDIVLLTVTTPRPSVTLRADAFGRTPTFWPGDTPNVWHGLVGVPLDAAAGTHTITVRSADAGGAAVEGVLGLDIAEKVFETRQLRVASRYVDPPAAERLRTERDAKRLAAIFERVTDRRWDGAFVPPVPGRATSSFGRLSVMNGEPRGRHLGADFSARTGTPVRAPNAGRVALAYDLFLSGNTIVIDHGGGLFSLLAHLSRMDVQEGDEVSRGDVLGASGATGRVTGPHLHWAVRLGDLSVDPQSLIAASARLAEPPATVVAR